jgi:RNase P/RNase MRP subunit p29
MEDKEMKLSERLKGVDVKIVWKEEEKTKVGRGQIIDDDVNFVYLTGEKGTVVVNRNDIIAIKTVVVQK